MAADSQAQPAVRPGIYLLALLLLSLFAWAPLLYPGYLQVHSGFLPVFNLAGLAASADKLHWWPATGVNTDLLQGEGTLAYWLAWLLRPLAGDMGAVKGVFASGFLLAGFGMYAWARRELADPAFPGEVSTRAGLLAGLLIMLWPPLLATVYVRGALAEALFMGLLPWALWAVVAQHPGGLRSSLERAGARWQVVLAGAGSCVLVALLYWTQAGLALWATGLLLAWALWRGRSWEERLPAVVAVLLGAGLGLGGLWLMHGDQGAVHLAQPAVAFGQHAIYPYQLFSPAWGFGVSTMDWKDTLPLQLGLAMLGLSALAVVLGTVRPGADAVADDSSWSSLEADDSLVMGSAPAQPEATVALSRPRPLAPRFALVASIIIVFLATTLARPLWNTFPALARPLIYPWQLLALAGPLLALLAASLLLVEPRLALLPAWAALAAFVVLSSYFYLVPRDTQVRPDLASPHIFGNHQVTLLTASPSSLSLEGRGAGDGETLSASQPITVSVSWQALQPLDFDYSVFVHALDDAGNRLAQWDGQPQRDGQPYPMTSWAVGEVVPNAYRLELTAEQAAAMSQIQLGLYNWQTGIRLPVGGDDKVELGTMNAER